MEFIKYVGTGILVGLLVGVLAAGVAWAQDDPAESDVATMGGRATPT